MFSNIVVKLIYQYIGLHFLWISWIHLKLASLMRYNSQSLFIVHRGKSTKLHPNEPWKIGEFIWFHTIVIVCQSDKTQISQLIYSCIVFFLGTQGNLYAHGHFHFSTYPADFSSAFGPSSCGLWMRTACWQLSSLVQFLWPGFYRTLFRPFWQHL